MYDTDFASNRRRKKIKDTNCKICIHYANAGSLYEWPCLILQNWICETHCTEVQKKDYEDIRNEIINFFGEMLDLKREKELLLICKKCPYGGGRTGGSDQGEGPSIQRAGRNNPRSGRTKTTNTIK